jgi:hypothetical protein
MEAWEHERELEGGDGGMAARITSGTPTPALARQAG